jgi:membrane-associated phospholipid phosphatase
MNKRFIPLLLTAVCCSHGPAAFSQDWDLKVAERINPQNPHAVVWRGATFSAYPLGIALPVGQFVYSIMAHDKSSRKKAYESLAGLVVSAAITETLKFSIDRQRPAEKHPDKIFPDKVETGRSFPSGHATIAFAAATSLALEYRKWYVIVPAYLWAGAVGYSRVYQGQHYPTDVIGGAIVGTGSALLSHWLCRKLLR